MRAEAARRRLSAAWHARRLVGPVFSVAAAWILALGATGQARAIGLEGAESADTRVGAGVGFGWDQVGGIGRDGYGFGELFTHGDARVWRGLTISGAATFREDLANYNFALEKWRKTSSGVVAQLALGFDGPAFHFSAGPWLYGDGRDGRAFRVGFLPWGVIRMRVGHLDGWHLNLRLVDGAPFTAEGGGAGLRLQVGARPIGRHRVAAGVYTSIGEKTVGVIASDEVIGTFASRTALRFGASLGTDYGYFGTRPELTGFAGLVW